MIRIFTPTYGRVNDQKSLKTLHPKLHRYVTLFARKQEVYNLRAEAARLAGKETPATVVQLPAKYTQHGYISAMQFLFKHAGSEPFIYMDDDITALRETVRFMSKPSEADRKRVETESRWYARELKTASDQLKLLKAILQDVLEPNVAACSPKPPHISPGGRLMRANGIMTAQHTVMFVAFNTARIREAGVVWGEHEGKPCLNAVSDALFNLQLMNAGLDCRYDCRYSFGAVPMFAGKGGINVDEGEAQRKQRVIEAHKQLSELFPRAVKLKVTPRVKKGVSAIDIPYIFQRTKFLKLSRQRLIEAGREFEPENDTRMQEYWTAWGKELTEEHYPLYTRPEDRELHRICRARETAQYEEEMKAWKARKKLASR